MATETPLLTSLPPLLAGGHCRLCELPKPLQDSHIIPAFFIRWLKETSGNIPMRNTKEPNLRVQDGLKRPWLCSDCEGILSKFETAFANNLFYPFIENHAGSYKYSQWLNRFCVSLSWRSIRYALETQKFANWSEDAIKRMREAELVWRECLLDKRPHPSVFEQHLVPFHPATRAGGFKKNINRYLLRDIEFDVISPHSDIVVTWAKVPRFVIIGMIYVPNKRKWEGGKVNAGEGVIAPRKYILPEQLAEYINVRCDRVMNAMKEVSPRQQAIIDKNLEKNLPVFVESDLFKTFQADATLFGESAILKDADKV